MRPAGTGLGGTGYATDRTIANLIIRFAGRSFLRVPTQKGYSDDRTLYNGS